MKRYFGRGLVQKNVLPFITFGPLFIALLILLWRLKTVSGFKYQFVSHLILICPTYFLIKWLGYFFILIALDVPLA